MLRHISRWIVRRFDALLRRTKGIWEFTQDEGCIIRLGRGTCRRALRLSDGTVLHPGDAVLEIHLWNERLPSMPNARASVAWGIRFVRRWRYSLALLAAHCRENPALSETAAIHAVFALPGGEGVVLQEQTLRTMGFDLVRPVRTPWRAFANFWENLYNWALIWTYNPASLRVRRLLRLRRCHLWMSWERLRDRYAAHESPA